MPYAEKYRAFLILLLAIGKNLSYCYMYTEEQYYQDIKNHLIGTSIIEVYYEVLNSYDELDLYEDWKLFDYIHSVDMNIIFKLDNGKLLQIFWDNNFHCYGVGLKVLSAFEKRETVKLINVSGNDSFSTLKYNKLVDVLIYWDEIETTNIETLEGFVFKELKGYKKIPLVWQIKFENNANMWIAAFEIRINNEHYYWADHLTVFFNENDIRKYKLNLKNKISVNT